MVSAVMNLFCKNLKVPMVFWFMPQKAHKEVQTDTRVSVQYYAMTVSDLKSECVKRRISTDGLKNELVDKLVKDDERIQLRPLCGLSPPPRLNDRNRARMIANRLQIQMPVNVELSAEACERFLRQVE